jgi:hypothetical protein
VKRRNFPTAEGRSVLLEEAQGLRHGADPSRAGEDYLEVDCAMALPRQLDVDDVPAHRLLGRLELNTHEGSG